MADERARRELRGARRFERAASAELERGLPQPHGAPQLSRPSIESRDRAEIDALLEGTTLADVEAVGQGVHSGPHSVLGQHLSADGSRVIVRALRPLADEVACVLSTGERVPMRHLAEGVFAGSHDRGLADYAIVARHGEHRSVVDDPYRYLPTLGELDLHLIGEGRHEELWRVLGAHVREVTGTDSTTSGVAFSVWAPNARAVRVVGSFNGWDGRGHAMRRLDGNGVWELFVPGLRGGERYKFQILGRVGHWRDKADPLARRAEEPPRTASIVEPESTYAWGDAEFLAHRASVDPHTQPISVYELHLGSWRPGLGYVEAADALIEYVTELGFTHVEFMPLAEHPFTGSWGYQVSGYYAATSRFGSPDELRGLIDRLHQAGIGVIMDWVPGHFPKDDFALGRFDGEAVYEHPDPRRGEQLDWGTYVFDFGRPQVRNFLVANALYWLEEFHIDALRVDAVASMLYLDYSRDEWLPNEHGGRENLDAIAFLQETNATAYRRSPGIMMIAEESTSWPGVTKPTSAGGLGFGLKWNMGWMNDTLRYFEKDPMYRSHHHGELTFSFVYAWSERFMLPISHDEVVHGKGSLIQKMPGDWWKQFAGVRAFLAYQWAHPGKQLLFMGQEFGQWSEWSVDRGLDWALLDQPMHQGLRDLVAALNRLYLDSPALWRLDDDPSGFVWIDGGDAQHSVLSFIRTDRAGDEVVVVTNFSGETQTGYRVGLPEAGEWVEVLSTDDERFGGAGSMNGAFTASASAWQGKPASAELTIPALGVAFFKRAS